MAFDVIDGGHGDEVSELNFVEVGEDGDERRTFLLSFIDRFEGFAKIGRELEASGVTFREMEHAGA